MTDYIADESVDKQIVLALRTEYDVFYVAEDNPGITDDDVLCLCEQRKAVLITAGKDFGELVFRFRRNHYGVVLCRLAGVDPEKKAVILRDIFTRHAEEMKFNFTVVGPSAPCILRAPVRDYPRRVCLDRKPFHGRRAGAAPADQFAEFTVSERRWRKIVPRCIFVAKT